MPQSLSCLLTHLVFSTKNREPLLTGEVAAEIHPYLVGLLNGVGCPSIQVGGVADHVHLFFRLSRTLTVADVVESVKTSSSKWIKTKGSGFSSFHWQSGYGAFSVSQSDANAVIAYIRNQPAHLESHDNKVRVFLRNPAGLLSPRSSPAACGRGPAAAPVVQFAAPAPRQYPSAAVWHSGVRES